MRRLLPLLLLLIATVAAAVTTIIIRYANDGTITTRTDVGLPLPPAPVPLVPVTTMRPTFLYINNTFPLKPNGQAKALGESTNKVTDNFSTCSPVDGTCPGRWPGEANGQVGHNGGAFRIFAARSHYAYDDPIVYPGQPGKSHLHVFFGNTQTTGVSTPTSIRTTGNSTSAGGILNRSAYWVPAMIYVCDTPAKITAGCSAARNGEVIEPLISSGMNVYYKGYFGTGAGPIEDLSAGTPHGWWYTNHTVQPFPVGFRMISGNPNATTQQAGQTGFACRVSEAYEPFVNFIPGSGTGATTAYTNCNGASRLIQIVHFPSCWNGVDLDSPSHNAHIVDKEQLPSLASGDFSCPTGFDTPMPGVEFKLHYNISGAQLYADMKFWRLSSDHYDTALPAGYSNHGDWFNGWDVATMAMWTTNCIVAGTDCHDNVLGPALSGAANYWRVLQSPRYDR